MNSNTNRKPDREHLLAVVDALEVSKANLRRDPCGDWNIIGRRGHISTDGIRSYVYLRHDTKRRWEKAKRALSFLTVTQDGDDEGVFKLGGIPRGHGAGSFPGWHGLPHQQHALLLAPLALAPAPRRLDGRLWSRPT